MNISPNTNNAYQLFHQGILAFARAERQGLRVDVHYINEKMEYITRKMAKLERELRTTNFFKHWQHSIKGQINIHSNPQLEYYLYKVKKVKVAKETKSGKGSTDDETLRQMGVPELDTLLQIRKLKKTRDTYLEAFIREQVDGYMHTNLNLHFAASYRGSSNSPNLQNIPVRDEEAMQMCRGALFPRPGYQIMEIDFKAIEVGINACINKDPRLVKYVSDPTKDMHADMTKQIFKVPDFDKHIKEHYRLRQAVKNGFVFPEFYGDYYKHCSGNLLLNWGKLNKGKFPEGTGIPMPEGTLADHLIKVGLGSFNKFEAHLKVIEDDFWQNRFSVYSKWKDNWYESYRKYGYFDLLSGFRCSGIMDKKQVCNYPGQGTAFHCLLWSFVELDKEIRKWNWKTRLVNQIHDSSVLDVHPKELNDVIDIAQEITTVRLAKHFPWITVPMMVEMALSPVDHSWADKKEI